MRLKLFRGSWYAVWREGGQTRRRALRTKDRAEAERTLADVSSRQAKPGDLIVAIYTAYLADKGPERARSAWKRLEPAFGALRPDQVGGKECRAYVAARRRAGASDGTIWTELTFLRAALRWADRNTKAIVELPAKPPPMDHYLTREEFERLLEGAEAPHVRLFILLALATAGRASAVLDLTWDRVDFEHGVIRLVRGEKRVKGRATVPMTERTRQALLEAAAARTSDYVVEYAGKRVARAIKGVKRAAERAGIPACSPHVLRHTAEVWMAESGVPMAEVAQFLGHSDSRVTERVYARYSPDHLQRAARALT